MAARAGMGKLLGPAQGGRGSAWARPFEGGGGGRASRLGRSTGPPGSRSCFSVVSRERTRPAVERPACRWCPACRGAARPCCLGLVEVDRGAFRSSRFAGVGRRVMRGRWAWACTGRSGMWARGGLSDGPMVRWSKAACHARTWSKVSARHLARVWALHGLSSCPMVQWSSCPMVEWSKAACRSGCAGLCWPVLDVLGFGVALRLDRGSIVVSARREAIAAALAGLVSATCDRREAIAAIDRSPAFAGCRVPWWGGA